MSSLNNIITSPPCLFLSRRHGCRKPSIMNSESAKLESDFVSVITNISTLLLIISFNWVKVRGSELIFKWPLTNLLRFFSLILFKCSTVSKRSVFGNLLFLSIRFNKSGWSHDLLYSLALSHKKNCSNKTLHFRKNY